MGPLFLVTFIYRINLTVLLSHPVHYSVTNIDVPNNSDTLSIVLIANADDMSLAVSNANKKAVYYVDTVGNDVQTLYYNYVQNFLHIGSLKQRKLPLIPVSIKNTESNVLLSFKVHIPKVIEEIQLRNCVLFDLFTDQTNLLIYSDSSGEKGYQTTYTEPETTIQITCRHEK